MRKYWLAILQGLVSIVLLWRIFGDATLRTEALKVFLGANPVWLSAGFGAAFLAELLSAARWWLVLRAFGTPMGFTKVVIFWWAGLFLSLGLPGTGGGDAFRVLYMMRLHPRRKLRASLSVLADRLCGLIVLVASVALSGIVQYRLFASDPAVLLLFKSAAALLGTILVLLLLWWITTLPAIRNRRKPWMPPSLAKRVNHLGAIFSGLTLRPGLIFCAVGIAFPAFIFHCLTYWCSARSFSLPLGVASLFTVMPVIDTLIALPITLFGLGWRESLFQHMLGGLYGITPATAALASLGGFCIQAAVALIGGLLMPFATSRQQGVRPSLPASKNNI
jgi:uncharacterized membrane protein YbhN (UPF0104 family)